LTGRRTADCRRWAEPIDAGPRAVAGVRRIADAAVRRSLAGRRRWSEAVRRAGARCAGAALLDVALTGRRTADRRRWADPIDARPRAVAGIGRIASAAVRGAYTRRRGRSEAVRRAGARRAGAALLDVALTGARSADRRRWAEPIDARPRAVAGIGG